MDTEILSEIVSLLDSSGHACYNTINSYYARIRFFQKTKEDTKSIQNSIPNTEDVLC